MGIPIKTPDELYRYVMDEYVSHDVEFNSSHFDVAVDMKKSDILDVYRDLQDIINDDIVYFPDGIIGMFKGCCRNFLLRLNNVPGYTRFSEGVENSFCL